MELYELDLNEVLGNTKKNSVWDKSVPIVKRENSYHCYLTGDIESPDNYNELCYVLESADENATVVLHINTGGGWIDSAFQIIDAIKKSKAFVIARLAGTVASAGTIISLSCDEIIVADHTHFMVHNYSTGTNGKAHEVVDYINFNDRTLKETFKSIYKGFLTEKEMQAVLKGKDMWLDAPEVRTRWTAYKETV